MVKELTIKEGTVEMKSLGKKHGMAVEAKGDDSMYFPGCTFTQEQLPALKGKSVGDKMMLQVEAKVCSVSEYGNGEIEYRVDLLKAGVKEK